MLVFTFLLFYHLRFGIDPVYQSWLFDTGSNSRNLHTLQYILLGYAYSYQID